jgi:hypothetical protein
VLCGHVATREQDADQSIAVKRTSHLAMDVKRMTRDADIPFRTQGRLEVVLRAPCVLVLSRNASACGWGANPLVLVMI